MQISKLACKPDKRLVFTLGTDPGWPSKTRLQTPHQTSDPFQTTDPAAERHTVCSLAKSMDARPPTRSCPIPASDARDPDRIRSRRFFAGRLLRRTCNARRAPRVRYGQHSTLHPESWSPAQGLG